MTETADPTLGQALQGIRVLDFTGGMAGPLATMILADYGAEVIRVEPAGGDPLWELPCYLVWNRGKKSIELDLTRTGDREQLRELMGTADVIVESLGHGEADRLGFGYPAASEINVQLVYCSLSAFGRAGPYRDLPPYDGIINAKSGRMRDQVGWHTNRPVYRAVNDVSYHSAMFVVQGILAALRVVWTTGRGQRVDTSLLRGVTSPNNPWRRFEGERLAPDREYDSSASGEVLSGELVANRYETDPYRAIPSQLCTECRDGRWIMHAHIQPELFRAWIDTIGFGWIWDDARYRGAPTSFTNDDDRITLNLAILARMKEKTSTEWIDLYRENPDCAGEVMRSTQEAMNHPQFIHNGHRIEVDDPRVGRMSQIGALVAMSALPARIAAAAPMAGGHTTASLLPRERRVAEVTAGPALRGPLDGVVMLELATWLAAPFAGALLADLGARVIKVETLTGDPMRATPKNENGIRAMQGKESISLDLKTEAGKKILRKLVRRADILMHNFRPGVPHRLGMDYQTCHAINPRLIYLYAASYGSSGPDSTRAAFNPTMGALTGNSVFQSGEGNPPIGDQSPDPIAGSGVATGIMLGLAARLRTGRGQYLETTMMNSIMYCNSDDAFNYEGKLPRRAPDHLQLGLEATYRLYETQVGWVFLATPTDGEFRRLCDTIGRPDIGNDARFSDWAGRYRHRDALGETLSNVFKSSTAEQWESLLTPAGLGCVRADGMSHRRFLHEDEHTRLTGFMVPAEHPLYAAEAPNGRYWRHGPVSEFSETPCPAGLPYVALGQHNAEILDQLGYGTDEIADLRRSGVIG